MFTVEKSDAANFYNALETAQREVDILHDLFDAKLPKDHLFALADVAHQFAAEDIKISLENFFDRRYSYEQFNEMLSLTEKYLSQTPIERFEKGSALKEMLELKSRFDSEMELSDFFAKHNFDDNQKAAITDLFAKENSHVLIEEIDESFTSEQIEHYAFLLTDYANSNQISNIENFFAMNPEERQSAAVKAKLPFEERFSDEIADMSTFLSSNERDVVYTIFYCKIIKHVI